MEHVKTLKIRNKEESHFCSGLYLVPTPIGNLRDITLRALDVLHGCDVLVCEDTRVSGKLLKAYGITVPQKIKYNDHADDAVKAHIVSLLQAGKIVAMISDAGTPMISDPGYKLVRDCIASDIYVTALPGANAILPAVQLSGIPSNNFYFLGFLPNKNNELKLIANNLVREKNMSVFYDSPKRVVKTLGVFADILPDRQLSISREISKLYEQTYRGTAQNILDELGDKDVKGEIVLVVDGASDNHEDHDVDSMIYAGVAVGQSIKDLSNAIADQTGLKKRDIYNRALEILKN